MTKCNTISISRGSDWAVSLAFKDEQDQAIDYSGASLSAVLLSNEDDSQLATPISVWDDAAGGLASLSLSELETVSVPIGILSRLRITTVTYEGTTKIWPTALVEGLA